MIDIARVVSQGGLAYGLELAERAAEGLPIRVAPWMFVPMAQLEPLFVHQLSADLGSMVLRWSDAKDGEFTHHARRGDKRRRINPVPADSSIDQLRDAIAVAAATKPPTAPGAVLQQTLDLERGCLLDIEVHDTRMEAEIRTGSARLLFSQSGSGVEVETVGRDPRLPSVDALESRLSHLTEMVGRLPRTDIGWHIEGALMETEPLTWILQLRPTPADRSVVNRRVPTSVCDRTLFVWGVFDLDVDLRYPHARTADGTSVAVEVRDDVQVELESTIIRSLQAGGHGILLNRASGFRLTHEPFNLPEAGLRRRYYAAHLPPSIGRRFRVMSDGTVAYFLES